MTSQGMRKHSINSMIHSASKQSVIEADKPYTAAAVPNDYT